MRDLPNRRCCLGRLGVRWSMQNCRVLLITRLVRRDGRDGGIGLAARLRSRRVVVPVLVLCRGAAGCRTMGL